MSEKGKGGKQKRTTRKERGVKFQDRNGTERIIELCSERGSKIGRIHDRFAYYGVRLVVMFRLLLTGASSGHTLGLMVTIFLMLLRFNLPTLTS